MYMQTEKSNKALRVHTRTMSHSGTPEASDLDAELPPSDLDAGLPPSDSDAGLPPSVV